MAVQPVAVAPVLARERRVCSLRRAKEKGRALHYVTSDELDEVEQRLAEEGYGDSGAYVYRDYSGRAMYGELCVGVVHDDPAYVSAFLYLLAEVTEEEFLGLLDLVRRSKQDSMGLHKITYWPRMQMQVQKEEQQTYAQP